MKSRDLLVFILLAVPLLLESCTAPANQSIIVAEARAPGTSCNFTDPTMYVENGAVDMSVYGTNSSYYQVYSWQNDLENISVTYGNSNITAETPNTFIASRIDLSYQVVGPSTKCGLQTCPTATAPPPGTINISAAITPGATFSTNSVGVYLMTPEAAQTLYSTVQQAAIQAQAPISYTLLVTFDLAGTLVGGGAAATNSVTYPVYLFYGIPPSPRDSLGCPVGSVSEMTSCNVPGRDIQYCICTGVGADGGPVNCPPIT